MLDGVNVGKVLIAVVVLLTTLYALQLLVQGSAHLARHVRGTETPLSRVLRFPRLQNMLLKLSVPLLAQAGALGVSAGDEPWHAPLGGAMLVAAFALVGGVCAGVRRACCATPDEVRLDVAAEPTARAPLPWLLGRPGADAVWVGTLVDNCGNLFENYWETRAAMATTPVLLAGSAKL